MSRGQEDWDNALRDALKIREAWHEFLGLIEGWDHLRFTEAQEYLYDLDTEPMQEFKQQVTQRIDSVVGSCVCDHYSRLPFRGQKDEIICACGKVGYCEAGPMCGSGG